MHRSEDSVSFLKPLSAAALLLALAVLPAWAQRTSAPRAPARRAPTDSFALAALLPRDPAVRIGTLPNGIRYYIRRNAKPEQRAELRLVVNAGSILEDDDQRGLAHFIEHMAFNGTTSFAKNDIVKYLESIGVRFGADLNAFTSFDETVYILPVPTDSAGILEKSFRFLGDVAGGILFDSTEVVAERGVVLAEWRTGLGAGERLRDQQFPVIFRGSRYADRLPIGKPEILEGANPAPLKRFWRDWYRPDLMAVVAVGDADPKRLEALVRSTFGRIPARPGARRRVTAAVPTHDSTLVSIATDKELSASSVGVLWKRPGRTTRTVGDLRQDLLERLYDQMLNQRLGELALKPETPFVGASAGGGSFVRNSAYYALDARAKEGQLLESLRAVLIEAERVRQHGFLPAELARATVNTLRGYERAYQERDKTPSEAFVEEYIGNYLEGEAIPGIAFEYAAMQRLLPTVTLAEVNALGADRVGEANRVVTVSLPDKDGLRVPTEAEIRAVFGTVNAAAIAPWVETVTAGALVAAAPPTGRVVSERKVASLDLTEWTLSNGIKVFVKPTDFTADQIVMSGWSPGGASLVSDRDVFKTSLTTTVLERGGVGDYSLVDLTKKLTGKVASATAVISDLSEGVSGRASPKDLETLLQLTWLRLTAPRADTSAFKALLQQFEQVLKNKDANPAAVFSDTVQMTLGGGHPRVRPLSVAMLQELDLREMLAIYRDRFADTGDFTFLFVGNVDLAVLKPLVEQWLAPLPAGGRRETFRDVGPAMFSGRIDKTVRKGIAPQSQTAIVLAGEGRWSREESYLLSSVGEVLEMRLLDRLRESLGGTYSVSVNTQFARQPRAEWQVVISYGSAPDKADAMFAAVQQELDSLRRVPPTAAEVERVREQQRRELEVARKQNGYWLSTLRARLEYGDDLGTVGAEDPLIAGLSSGALAAAATRYLTETNRARFVLLPEGR
ncbi:MAG: insulinase family protein [Gemmatimonadota bacterium]|nr:insulinase family protein [Gemmatimonadota bacterium]